MARNESHEPMRALSLAAVGALLSVFAPAQTPTRRLPAEPLTRRSAVQDKHQQYGSGGKADTTGASGPGGNADTTSGAGGTGGTGGTAGAGGAGTAGSGGTGGSGDAGGNGGAGGSAAYNPCPTNGDACRVMPLATPSPMAAAANALSMWADYRLELFQLSLNRPTEEAILRRIALERPEHGRQRRVPKEAGGPQRLDHCGRRRTFGAAATDRGLAKRVAPGHRYADDWHQRHRYQLGPPERAQAARHVARYHHRDPAECADRPRADGADHG